MEALAYDLRRLLEADRATFALSPEAHLAHSSDHPPPTAPPTMPDSKKPNRSLNRPAQAPPLVLP